MYLSSIAAAATAAAPPHLPGGGAPHRLASSSIATSNTELLPHHNTRTPSANAPRSRHRGAAGAHLCADRRRRCQSGSSAGAHELCAPLGAARGGGRSTAGRGTEGPSRDPGTSKTAGQARGPSVVNPSALAAVWGQLISCPHTSCEHHAARSRRGLQLRPSTGAAGLWRPRRAHIQREPGVL